jgi:hypothetical protein
MGNINKNLNIPSDISSTAHSESHCALIEVVGSDVHKPKRVKTE